MRHETVEKNIGLMIVLIVVAISFGGLVEIVPLFYQKEVTEPVAGLQPLPALALEGRDIYIREGCNVCHTQMIRPLRAETERYGHYSVAGEFVYDHPFLWGSRRIGPDLARVGGKYPDLWHVRHMEAPATIVQNSIMPKYPQMLTTSLDFEGIQSRVDAMAMLGVPYGDAVTNAPALARAQAQQIAEGVAAAGGPADLADKEIVALVAYLQRLGADIRKGGMATSAGTAATGGGL
jgi:cbb3-type cytochrome c oxidase subunit II